MKRILLVEDDIDIREAIEEVLIHEGYEVISATDGEDGLEKIHSHLPIHLILLDLMMPRKDGYQFREEQLKDSGIAQIPVVIMSADGRSVDKREKMQANEYIRKPLEIDHFLEVIGRVMK